ncbi:MAG TPA: glycosyl hydrolase family 28-related protein [Pyrinomonadaceae bacterium]|nr:glycosyl hydrolase family 28-related protein [Pyrinomonadaceae bacterium]
MKKLSIIVKLLVSVVFTLAVTSMAQAQATRTWVSGVGDDVNPCSRTAPCKTWAGAISKTAAGGEIDALDPGGYGTLTITKSITVDGTTGAGFGSTLNSGGINGFVINDSLAAAPRTINVTIRNVSIDGAGTTQGLNGIRFISGRTLNIENVQIFNQSNNGVDVDLSGGVATDRSRVYMRDVDIHNIGQIGIRLQASAAYLGVYMQNVRVKRATTGVSVGNNSFPFIKDSMFSGLNTGVLMVNNATGSPVALLDGVDLSENTTGLSAGNLTKTLLTRSNITVCTTGISGLGGVVQSSGNNTILGNSSDGLTPTIIQPK